MNFELSWDQCGLIADLTKRLGVVSPQFGKTVLQKMVFLLQEVYKVDVGYSFGFHTFGPFAGELLGDLDFAERMGAVVVKPVDGAYGYGYSIEPGNDIEKYLGKARVFLDKHSDSINKLVCEFGKKKAKDLELLTTIVYLNKEISSDETKMTRDEAVDKIHELKPKFSSKEIQDGMVELEREHNVTLIFRT